MSSAPRIAPIPIGEPRPLWSVMIPTYNCAHFLTQTLESVLAQDLGPDRMQIEVIDDCSTQDDPAEVVQRVGKGRVAFFRKSRNEGISANFNTCLGKSRGQLVHILHGDDYTLPNFYAEMGELALAHTQIGLLYGLTRTVNEKGLTLREPLPLPELLTPSEAAGLLLTNNPLLTPGVVVRRSVYETTGGFLPQLSHVADWEMWTRAGIFSGFASSGATCAAYRFFPQNDTSRLVKTAQNLREMLLLECLWLESGLPQFDRSRFRKHVVWVAENQMLRFALARDGMAFRDNAQVWRELAGWPRWLVFMGKYLRDRFCDRRA